MPWDFGVVAFLDILGFSSLVSDDARAPLQSPVHLESLRAGFAAVKESSSASTLNLRWFSDSIVAASALTLGGVTTIIDRVAALQQEFLRRGLLLRGGVAMGKHFADELTVYSEALVRAYMLERHEARFPRVVVDVNLLDWFGNNTSLTAAMRADAVAQLLRDRDDRVFVGYLRTSDLGGVRTLFETWSTKSIDPGVLEKLQWLAAYHNYVAGPTSVAVTGRFVAGFSPWQQQ